jgi:hypothetical protein
MCRHATGRKGPQVIRTKAREMAGDLHAKVKLGQDPAAQKAEAKEQAADSGEAARLFRHDAARDSGSMVPTIPG